MTNMWDRFKTAVQAIDVADLDRDDLGALAGEIGSARAALDGLEARVTVGMRRLGVSEASTAETLRRQTGCSAREAKHRTRRAEILGKMPNVGEALSSGRLTGEHASVLWPGPPPRPRPRRSTGMPACWPRPSPCPPMWLPARPGTGSAAARPPTTCSVCTNGSAATGR